MVSYRRSHLTRPYTSLRSPDPSVDGIRTRDEHCPEIARRMNSSARSFPGGAQDSDARALGDPVEVRTELVVVVAEDETRSVAEGCRECPTSSAPQVLVDCL